MPIRFFTAALILSIMTACGNQSAKQPTGTTTDGKDNATPSPFTLSTPVNGAEFKVGDTLHFFLYAAKDNPLTDSCVLLIGGAEAAKFAMADHVSFDSKDGRLTYRYEVKISESSKVGSLPVTLVLKSGGKEVEKLSITIKVYPASKPDRYTYEVVKSYPHDDNAYTQGLFIHNGEMYESTGQYGQSSLRKVNMTTGKVLQSVSLDKQYFGEGIALLDGKIYMLTWESRKGFIFDSKTFERIGEFSYPTEGWGLATDGKLLIMSDGSSVIRFIDPNGFKEVRSIEVCEIRGHLKDLNELEYIDGELWANVYMQDALVCINPATGAITKVVDMRGLLPDKLRTQATDVLNGIAFDPAKKSQLIVTGKNWPMLYEVKLAPQKN